MLFGVTLIVAAVLTVLNLTETASVSWWIVALIWPGIPAVSLLLFLLVFAILAAAPWRKPRSLPGKRMSFRTFR